MSLNTFQSQVREYGGSIIQSVSNITTPTPSVIMDIPPTTKAINISSYNLVMTNILDLIYVQLGDNVSFITDGYSDLNNTLFPIGFAFSKNNINQGPHTNLMPLIISDHIYTGILLRLATNGVQYIQLPYVATRLRFICKDGALFTSGNITVNFSQ